MNLFENLRTAMTDASGGVTVDSENLTVTREAFDDGYALYLDATCPVGFAAEDSIVLRPTVPDTGDYLSIAAHSEYWCRPQWGESLRDLHPRTQELLIHNSDGTYTCLLPVCDSVFKTLLRSGEGGLEIVAHTNCAGVTECRRQLALVCMNGTEPLTLLGNIAKKTADLLGGLKMRAERTVAPLFEYLGWCSWDALQIRVSHRGLMEKAEEFKQKDVPVKFAIIDDMWADVPGLNNVPTDTPFGEMVKIMHGSRMNDFAGDPERFPDGMGAAITDLKASGIPHIGVWFPTTGYWSGLIPDSPIMQTIGEHTVVNEAGQHIVRPTDEDATAVYSEFCERVKSWGGDFVKIDCQGMQRRYRNVAPIGAHASALQRAIDSVTARVFDGALINCMGMPSECMFHRPQSAISRCSDDFMPESRAWFAKNILQCSYNGVLQGQYYVNDWDMWWTDDEQARKNSLCRAVSGGPIYVSDKIGRTRPEILRPLALADGRILRCEESATPTADCLMEDPTQSGKIFKIRNRKGTATLAAVFNIDAENRAVSGTLSAVETGQDADTDCIWYEYFTGACGLLGSGKALELSLCDNDTFRLYTFLPMAADEVRVIGRKDLMIGAGAVISQEVDAARGETVAVLCEGGEVVFYAPTPVKVLAGGAELTPVPCGIGGFYTVTVGADVVALRFIKG